MYISWFRRNLLDWHRIFVRNGRIIALKRKENGQFPKERWHLHKGCGYRTADILRRCKRHIVDNFDGSNFGDWFNTKLHNTIGLKFGDCRLVSWNLSPKIDQIITLSPPPPPKKKQPPTHHYIVCSNTNTSLRSIKWYGLIILNLNSIQIKSWTEF